MKKLIFSLAIIMAVLLLAPLPKSVKTQFYAVDTLSNEPVSISIDMMYLRFLVLENKLSGTITVSAPDGTTVYGEHLHYSGLWPSNNDDKVMHVFGGFYFNDTFYTHDYGDGILGSKLVGFEPVQVYFSPDFSKILLLHQGSDVPGATKTKQYIGNCEEKKIEETKIYFTGFLENTP